MSEIANCHPVGRQLLNVAAGRGDAGLVVHFGAGLHCGVPDTQNAGCKFKYIYYSGFMETDNAIAMLAALAQPTRLETFRLLVKHEPEGVPAGELARMLHVPQNTMSAHLASLSRVGLIEGERQSRSILYRARLGAFRDLTLFLLKDCCGGNAELCAPLIAELTPCCTGAAGAETLDDRAL